MPDERIHAPDFAGALDWLNVPGPLTLKALRGKVVLLDFWTYGCINCMHVLPDLRRLEEKYRDELVVVGIHSAKFTNERSSENLAGTGRQAGWGPAAARRSRAPSTRRGISSCRTG